MGAALNIKDARTHELAAELARRTGLSMSKAVALALEEKLAQLKAERDRAWDDWARKMDEARLPPGTTFERDTSPPRELDWD
jgi:hypothetical protein